jgi:hypothetical protein
VGKHFPFKTDFKSRGFVVSFNVCAKLAKFWEISMLFSVFAARINLSWSGKIWGL